MMKLAIGILLFFVPLMSFAQSTEWRITKPQWTVQDEKNFGSFITRLGEAVERRECDHVDTCLKSSANQYAGTDPSSLRLFADCADLPYYLRSYFAWKNGLPMSVAKGISVRDPSQANMDTRYSRFGNYVTGRYDVLSTTRNGRSVYPSAVDNLNRYIINTTYTGSFRMIGLEDRGAMTDFYPVRLSRQTIVPGTVIYDPNGHVAVIYKVTEDGRIFYIDSHPDNTLTSGMYTPKFARSTPAQGAGFKKFRPLALVGGKLDRNGAYVGGKIVGAKNAQLAEYSLEQFYGNRPDAGGDWQKGLFVFNGQQLSYYDYLRMVMASGDLRIDPLLDVQELLQDICVSLRDRVVAVDVSARAGIYLKPHPERLPYNIYGTTGEWEDYASPSRDARLKVSYMDVLAAAKDFIHRNKVGDPTIVYRGSNLAADLLKVYDRESRACQFAYRNSSGSPVTLNLEDARVRVFAMSFDPYHCPELRWGASTPQELASCRDDANKREWYSRERWLRYQWERTYEARMDYSLEELTGPKPGAGIAQPPDVDIVRYLSSQR
ncbi:hypothetical protein [Bdellovibrio sp. HCB2-146]|uniref:hypothetical protein n=1 Tax=Bdellovibrio sp. HCB2-146 TaxID=3394362 RepID=UPI0039BD4A0D